VLYCKARTTPATCNKKNTKLKPTMHKDIKQMSDLDINRIIEMAWEDRTSFEAINIQFGFKESDVIALMRSELKRSSFNLWRKRVHSGVSQKHAKKRDPDMMRFKCSMQKTISMNKISKR
jgi:uncharacterized protein (TIGR03643 family)